jgi:D-sedoheptulose 7-phosphate isomerase
MRGSPERHFATLLGLIQGAEVSDLAREPLTLSKGFERFEAAVRAAHASGNKVMFIGNGGSAGIASHMAIDFSKNGDLSAIALNDAAALTCFANDYGYDLVFAKQIDRHARAGDVLVAVSSSGRSPSILNAVDAARSVSCTVLTFSGFEEDNPLRSAGDLNFYVRSDRYGLIEVAHLSLCHAILDLGWGYKG